MDTLYFPYACAVSANNDGAYGCQSQVKWAISLAEATLAGLEGCRKTFPLSKGWGGHQASVVLVKGVKGKTVSQVNAIK